MEPAVKAITVTVRTEFENESQTAVFQMSPLVFNMSQYRPVGVSKDGELVVPDRSVLILQGECLGGQSYKDAVHDAVHHPTLASWLEALLASKKAGHLLESQDDPVRRLLTFVNHDERTTHTLGFVALRTEKDSVEAQAQQFGMTLAELEVALQTREGREALCQAAPSPNG